MTERELTNILNRQFAHFFGQVSQHVDARVDDKIEGLRSEVHDLRNDIDTMRCTLDGVASFIESGLDEQVIINTRHDRWIHQLARKTNTSLTPGAA